MRVDPQRFTGLPLITKALAANDYSVLIDRLRAGRIMLQPRAFGEARWFWTITGPVLVQANLNSHGETDNLAEARQAFRDRFDEWHAWALRHDGVVHWLT